MHQDSAQAMPLMGTAVGRRFWDVAEKVPTDAYAVGAAGLQVLPGLHQKS